MSLGYSPSRRRARAMGRVLPFLLPFLRAEPGNLAQGSGHRCSVSDRFRATWPEPLPPGGTDFGSGESWFEPMRVAGGILGLKSTNNRNGGFSVSENPR